MADGGATTHGDVATERNRAWVERENDNELTAELGEGTTRLELVGEARIERRRPADAVGEGGGWRRLDPVLAVGVEEDAVLLDSLERRGGASGRDDGDVPATSPLGRMRQRGRLREGEGGG